MQAKRSVGAIGASNPRGPTHCFPSVWQWWTRPQLNLGVGLFMSKRRWLLEEAHRVGSRPLGELALYLTQTSVARARTLNWAAELRKAAALLEEFAGQKPPANRSDS